jgi:hypothetical protein
MLARRVVDVAEPATARGLVLPSVMLDTLLVSVGGRDIGVASAAGRVPADDSLRACTPKQKIEDVRSLIVRAHRGVLVDVMRVAGYDVAEPAAASGVHRRPTGARARIEALPGRPAGARAVDVAEAAAAGGVLLRMGIQGEGWSRRRKRDVRCLRRLLRLSCGWCLARRSGCPSERRWRASGCSQLHRGRRSRPVQIVRKRSALWVRIRTCWGSLTSSLPRVGEKSSGPLVGRSLDVEEGRILPRPPLPDDSCGDREIRDEFGRKDRLRTYVSIATSRRGA